MSTIINPPPILQVPSLLWGGGGSSTTNLYKVPFHTFGTAKKRYLRIKPYNDDDGSTIASAQSVEIALFDDNQTNSTKRYYIVKAEYPLRFIWSDPTANNNNESTTTKSSLLSTPLFKKNSNEQHELLIDDIIEIVKGNSSSAFQAYIAKNGSNSIPSNSECCFSLVTEERSVDFFVQSTITTLGLNDNEEGDVQLATALIDSIHTLLDNFHNRKNKNTHQQQQQQHHQLKSITSPTAIRIMQQFDATLHSKLLFQAARASNIGSLRYYFDIKGCPIDFMDDESGDTVLIIACRLGLFDVARLALLGYNAKNDPHPAFGQTALQVAVSSGHTDIVRLILQTAERSNADTIIVNHEDSSQEAPVHVASRIGSLDILELLVEHGANLGLVDGRGRTCLHCSAQSGQDECLLFILDNLAEDYILEVRCYDGYTPLHVAIRSNKIECVKVLLQAGADVTAESSNGSCFNMASKQRSDRIMSLLLEYDISDQDSYDSYNDDHEDESSEEVDMFRGLIQYNAASPASTNPDYHNVGSPYNGGTLVSPTNQSSMNYINRSPLYAAGAVSLPPSVFARGEQISHSPVRVNNQLSTLVSNTPQQRHQYSDGGEFNHEGCVWKIYATHDGYTYFYNESNNYSTWEDPRLSGYAASPSRSPLVSRNVGQNHYQQQTTPTKKLTAIPSPVATRTRPSSAASTLSSYKTERSRTNQNHEPNTGTTNTSQSVEVQYQPLQSGGSKSAATASLPLQSQHDLVEPTIQSRSTLPPNILTSSIESGASGGKANVDSKQLLLDQIKSRSEKKEQVDPKSMLLAHIKSRASSQDDLLASSKLSSPSTKSMKDNVQVDNDTKSKLLAQIKSRGSYDDHSTQSTPLPTKSSTDTTGSSKNDPELARYIKMKSVGLPSAAVLHKMEMDKVDASKIKLFRAQLDKQSARAAAADNSTIEQTPIISPKRQSRDKLKQMLSQDEIEMFKEYHSLAKDSPTTNTTTPARTLSTSKKQQQTPMEKYANLTEEDLSKDDTFTKYRKMKVRLSCVLCCILLLLSL